MEMLVEGKVDRAYVNYVKEAPTKGASAASVAPVSARSKPGWASRDKKEKSKSTGVCGAGEKALRVCRQRENNRGEGYDSVFRMKRWQVTC